MSRRASQSVALPIAMVVLIGSACASARQQPVAPVVARSPSPTLVWRNQELRPVGQPKAVGGVAVGIVSTLDDGLRIVGLDPVTGRELWRDPITPGAGTPGVAVHFVTLDEGRVAYLRATNKGTHYSQVVVADAHTGHTVAVTNVAFLASLWACGDGRDVCTTTRRPDRWHRVEVPSGRIVSADEELPNVRSLGEGLLDLGDRPGNTVGRLRDDRIYWRTPLGAAFPAGFSSDYGWSWHFFVDQGAIVGSVHGPSTREDGRVIREMANIDATAGLHAITGAVLWSDRGSSFHCQIGEVTHPVRCRTRGIITYQKGSDPSFDGLDVTFEGFDVTTGKTTWSVSLGPAQDLLDFKRRTAIAGPTRVVLHGPRGPIVLDYATGVTEPAHAGTTYWCMTLAEYELTKPDDTPDKRFGGYLASVCDAERRPATTLPSVDATAAAGARIGDDIAIATSDGYAGYRATP